MFKVPEKFRYTGKSQMSTTSLDGNNGVFFIPYRIEIAPNTNQYRQFILYCIASQSHGWEHVSVTLLNDQHKPLPICPDWFMMAAVKKKFWGVDDVVMELHVAEKDHVNNHPYCLHLWRPTFQVIPTPPAELVGIKDLNPDQAKVVVEKMKEGGNG
jgi:hypothetical protein